MGEKLGTEYSAMRPPETGRPPPPDALDRTPQPEQSGTPKRPEVASPAVTDETSLRRSPQRMGKPYTVADLEGNSEERLMDRWHNASLYDIGKHVVGYGLLGTALFFALGPVGPLLAAVLAVGHQSYRQSAPLKRAIDNLDHNELAVRIGERGGGKAMSDYTDALKPPVDHRAIFRLLQTHLGNDFKVDDYVKLPDGTSRAASRRAAGTEKEAPDQRTAVASLSPHTPPEKAEAMPKSLEAAVTAYEQHWSKLTPDERMGLENGTPTAVQKAGNTISDLASSASQIFSDNQSKYDKFAKAYTQTNIQGAQNPQSLQAAVDYANKLTKSLELELRAYALFPDYLEKKLAIMPRKKEANKRLSDVDSIRTMLKSRLEQIKPAE